MSGPCLFLICWGPSLDLLLLSEKEDYKGKEKICSIPTFHFIFKVASSFWNLILGKIVPSPAFPEVRGKILICSLYSLRILIRMKVSLARKVVGTIPRKSRSWNAGKSEWDSLSVSSLDADFLWLSAPPPCVWDAFRSFLALGVFLCHLENVSSF